MSHIFISYSHKNKDKEYVEKLEEALVKEGFEVWVDHHIDYGDEWLKVIQKYLDRCDAFIIVMSDNSFESDMVQNEVTRAREKKKPIFPLLFDGENWLIVQAKQYVDVRDGSLPPEKFYKLLEKVTPRKKILAIVPPVPVPGTRSPRRLKLPKLSVDPKVAFRVLGIVAILSIVVFGVPQLVTLLGQIQFPTRIPTSTLKFTPTVTETLRQSTATTTAESITASPTKTPTPFPSQFTDKKGVPMVLVPAGNFIMGSENGYDDEKPSHTVFLDIFYIDTYEVTNKRYKDCVDDGECDQPFITSRYGNSSYANHPIVYADWDMAKEYCDWRGAVLPNEAQWEKAARGTDRRTYPWGEVLDKSFANYNYSVGDTTIVGSYENGKSPYGVYDMAGNVWEWTSSLFQPYPYSSTDGRENLESLGGRVIRGGGWTLFSIGFDVKTFARSSRRPSSAEIYIGFRCALSIKP
jgi:formylglycine-generating enzyme required for sulfatase activity